MDIEDRLTNLAREYRSLRYTGPAPHFAPRRRRSYGFPALAMAAGVTFAAALWVLQPGHQFGARQTAMPSPYAALKAVRSNVPGSGSIYPPQTLQGPTIAVPRRPVRVSGFAEPDPSNAQRSAALKTLV